MSGKLRHSLLILASSDLNKTSNYYVNILKFKAVKYLQIKAPHICLYRDDVEIILIKSNLQVVQPNRILHKTGYGYDGYFTVKDSKSLQKLFKEISSSGAKIVQNLQITEYGNEEFVIEDIDGKWLAIGKKI